MSDHISTYDDLITALCCVSANVNDIMFDCKVAHIGGGACIILKDVQSYLNKAIADAISAKKAWNV